MKTIIRDNTNKKDIVNKVFNKMGIPSSYAGNLFDDLISIIIFNLLKKKKLKIKNFGTFHLRKKNRRIGRNPKNRINHNIIERNVLTYKASIDLNKKINTNAGK